MSVKPLKIEPKIYGGKRFCRFNFSVEVAGKLLNVSSCEPRLAGNGQVCLELRAAIEETGVLSLIRILQEADLIKLIFRSQDGFITPILTYLIKYDSVIILPPVADCNSDCIIQEAVALTNARVVHFECK